jgi:tryptophan 2,3-dioxygenase
MAEYGKGAPLSYARYLKVHELLDLQHCLSQPPHPDELLFIVIHQAYELWFKLILHSLDECKDALGRGQTGAATLALERVIEIEKLLIQQIHILETMAPARFLEFRDRLNPASGFQSFQFREIETLAGLAEPAHLDALAGDVAASARLRSRLEEPNLWHCFSNHLLQRGLSFPPEDPRARCETLRQIYEHREAHPELYRLAEALIEFDEHLQLWRYHHVRMVERMIGFKRGTGGSEGVGYLVQTLGRKCFPELWEVRTHLTAQ